MATHESCYVELSITEGVAGSINPFPVLFKFRFLLLTAAFTSMSGENRQRLVTDEPVEEFEK